jgi:hypothetical protein
MIERNGCWGIACSIILKGEKQDLLVLSRSQAELGNEGECGADGFAGVGTAEGGGSTFALPKNYLSCLL